MSKNFDSDIERFYFETTESYDYTEEAVEQNSEEKGDFKETWLFYEVDPFVNVIVASVIFCVGLVLNAVILRCYWSVKTSTAVYARGLAWIAICAMFYMLTFRITELLFPYEPIMETVSKVLGNQIAIASVLGPLFMALDRILIVAFPHSFKKHEKKMRIAKIAWAMYQSIFITSSFVATDIFNVNVFEILAVKILQSLSLMIPCTLCVALYATIVYKVRASGRKIRPTTQVKNANQ